MSTSQYCRYLVVPGTCMYLMYYIPGTCDGETPTGPRRDSMNLFCHDLLLTSYNRIRMDRGIANVGNMLDVIGCPNKAKRRVFLPKRRVFLPKRRDSKNFASRLFDNYSRLFGFTTPSRVASRPVHLYVTCTTRRIYDENPGI
jgi:hypothetical protein